MTSLARLSRSMYTYLIGAIIRRLIEDYWKKTHIEEGYELLYTPHVANLNLWKTSGHFDFYKDVSNTIAFLCNCLTELLNLMHIPQHHSSVALIVTLCEIVHLYSYECVSVS
jgi:threonyl-tRNA synthetase